ncbi:RHS repeat protein, partial [Pseudomonas lundensis]|uniref:RHS repeat-associated core domain-containing protein n=1 Tax=Pseudomonas lundensis TaxID=86185 RepID=UPI00164343BC
DERGNQIRRWHNGQQSRLHWDLFDRLVRFENSQLRVDYAYDPLGRRLYKHSNAHHLNRSEAGSQWNRNEQARKQRELGCGFTLFGWDGDTLAWESSPAQADGAAGRTVHYIFEPDGFVPVAQALRHQPMRLLAQPSYTGAYDIDQDPLWTHTPQALPIDVLAWYQCDHLGTPQELTDPTGQIAWSAQYKAWGEVTEQRTEWAQRQGLTNPIRFQGQYHDHETGLHYNRYRYYDPRVGRFVSKDPISYAGGLNLYAYAPNPVGWVDPLGLAGRKTSKPRIEFGNHKEGWQHIDERHISGTHPSGAGDLFPEGTTKEQILKVCECLVKKGARISDPNRQIQTFEKRVKVNGRKDRVRGVFDSEDGNRTITVFPVRSE